ncbi:hypothetical protein TNCV_4028921 [Trichonephila clavipes]|nr:hypothetical protein TNCV_4028921 [Trichonephila clavipes]
MINGRTRLHVVANGNMTGHDTLMKFYFLMFVFFRGAVGDKFVFMDDNATCHRTLAVQDCLRQRGQVSGRNYPPTNKNTLIRALTEEWDKLPQQLLDNVVQSMASAWDGGIKKSSEINKSITNTVKDISLHSKAIGLIYGKQCTDKRSTFRKPHIRMETVLALAGQDGHMREESLEKRWYGFDISRNYLVFFKGYDMRASPSKHPPRVRKDCNR